MAGYSKDGFNVNSNKSHHAFIVVDGKTIELDDLIDGNCIEMQRTVAKSQVVVTYEGKPIANETANDTGTGTITTVEGGQADRLITALMNDSQKHNIDVIFTNESTGLVAKSSTVIFNNTPQAQMGNAAGQPAFPFNSTSYVREYDGDTVEKLLNA